jgi:hypothetical protein
MSTPLSPSEKLAARRSHEHFASVQELIADRRARSKLRADDVFFFCISLLILAIVYLGFEESFFRAGLVFADLPNRLVAIHGGLFVGWIFLLLAQTSLVMARRIVWHVRLGVVSLIWIPLLLAFGFLTLFDSIRRGPPIPPEIMLVGDSEELLIFAALSVWGLVVRRSPAAHKRLMTLGTMAMLGPAIDRFARPWGIGFTIAIYIAMPLIVVIYDAVSRRRVHHTTVIATILIAGGMLTLLPVTTLPIWHSVLAWVVS